MGMNTTPASERVHIAFFGRRNAGKSSLINAVTGQELSVVSDVAGTTTDPVYKTMELLPIGPVVIIDTPGYDDEGALGELRVKKTRQVLNRADCGILVVDATVGLGGCEKTLVALFEERKLPYLVVWNKADAVSVQDGKSDSLFVSAKTGAGIYELKERIGALLHRSEEERRLIGDRIAPGDVAVLVVPIDEAAPKGRLILPQQQTIRDILEAEGMPIVVKDTGLQSAFSSLAEQPAMVITDSQVFGKVAKQVPAEVPLTSFSILMARYKGFLSTAVEGVRTLEKLQNGDKILISEGCTHHGKAAGYDSEVYREGSGVCVYLGERVSGRFDRDSSGHSLRWLHVNGTGAFLPEKDCGGRAGTVYQLRNCHGAYERNSGTECGDVSGGGGAIAVAKLTGLYNCCEYSIDGII